ncbi:MAG: hypothetical protein IPF79_09160 [Ignavibacteria bacterium]|nr:hypothetical protein [Ignavibacteria bacterium]
MGSLLDKKSSCYGVLPKSKDYLAPEADDSALRLCRGEDVRSNCLKWDEWVKIPNEYRSERSLIRNGDLLILIKGKTIDSEDGVSWVSEEIPDSIFNGSVFRVALKEADPRFLYAFFRTPFFTKQKRRFIANATVEYNSIGQIAKYMTICPPAEIQNEIGQIVERHYELLRKCRDLRLEAGALLDSEMGLDKFSFHHPLAYTANSSEVLISRRFDPEHYNPEFTVMRKALFKNRILKSIQTLSAPLITGVQPLYTDSGRYSVINSKHIATTGVREDERRRADWVSTKDLAYKGDILLNATGRGTIGRCAVVDEAGPVIFDVCIIRIRPLEIDPIFCSALLNSRFGQVQIESHIRGTSGQLHLYPKDASKVLLWDAPKELQSEIRRLHERATEAESDSKRLLEEAKARVEQLIEEPV